MRSFVKEKPIPYIVKQPVLEARIPVENIQKPRKRTIKKPSKENQKYYSEMLVTSGLLVLAIFLWQGDSIEQLDRPSPQNSRNEILDI